MGLVRQNPYLLLLGALDFSAADLAANRQGKLTAKQRTQLEQKRLRTLQGWIVAICGLIAGGVALHMRLIVIVFGSATLVTLALYGWLKYNADFSERVQRAQGQFQFTSQLGWPFYILQIGDEQFRVSSRLKRAFQAGDAYRVYYTVGSRTILSAEMAA
ncbi:MAG: hypothetical protein K8L97_19310 [Anaerolineae bacterium]|nr:hypothetical protein [Anaerolineae bacterium]